jgi:hypothetical protein
MAEIGRSWFGVITICSSPLLAARQAQPLAKSRADEDRLTFSSKTYPHGLPA